MWELKFLPSFGFPPRHLTFSDQLNGGLYAYLRDEDATRHCELNFLFWQGARCEAGLLTVVVMAIQVVQVMETRRDVDTHSCGDGKSNRGVWRQACW
jgi:hypothetical protein